MLSVLQSVLTQDRAPDYGHDQARNYDADEHWSRELHDQFAHRPATPPTSVPAWQPQDSGVAKLTVVDGYCGTGEVKECETVPKEAQRPSDQDHDHLPVTLGWVPPLDVTPKGLDFNRPGKRTLPKTAGSRHKQPKSNREAGHDGLLTAAMLQTIDRIGGVQVLEGLRDTIAELNVRARQDRQNFNERCSRSIPKHLTDQPESMRKLWLLKEELLLTETSEQIYRLRKRLTLAEFSHAYDACALRYMDMKSSPQRPRSRPGQRPLKTATNREARNSQHKRAAMDHFVNVLFPGALPSSKTKRAARKGGMVTRYAGARKIQNWRATGQPWANIITRFGKGILLLIPDEVSDAYHLTGFSGSCRATVAGLENWLQTLTSLVDSICINHALPHNWLSEECPSWFIECGRTNAQVWKADPDPPSAFCDGGAASWSPLKQSCNVDQQYTESGFIVDPPMDAKELGLYTGESSSQFCLAPHETVWEAPYTTFLSHLAGETDLSSDLCSAFVSSHDGFPLPPSEGTGSFGVDIDSLLAMSPMVPSLTIDAPSTDASHRASTSANYSYSGLSTNKSNPNRSKSWQIKSNQIEDISIQIKSNHDAQIYLDI
ncbi:hypothetical protein K469DRAFT_796570 [Zopfia rhizophila CBS 207.26]|uniref:Uncharacterized protein n=1 Tax=Zopfia rhizophila CBS 207.26 TaxID=1314779 RepID=A0A6A6DPZ0_9PEZI|nr:hypothetical protein K469DRAFT_796570 [Zopfia rhizophila CBS 207.26]